MCAIGAFWKVKEEVFVGKKEKLNDSVVDLGKLELKYLSHVSSKYEVLYLCLKCLGLCRGAEKFERLGVISLVECGGIRDTNEKT